MNSCICRNSYHSHFLNICAALVTPAFGKAHRHSTSPFYDGSVLNGNLIIYEIGNFKSGTQACVQRHPTISFFHVSRFNHVEFSLPDASVYQSWSSMRWMYGETCSKCCTMSKIVQKETQIFRKKTCIGSKYIFVNAQESLNVIITTHVYSIELL